MQDPLEGTYDRRLTLASALAALVCMSWDATINFGDEVEFIWSRPNSWMKWVYAFIRYIPILHETFVFWVMCGDVSFSARACNGWLIEQVVVTGSLMLTVEVVLMLRVRILYHGHPKVLRTISVALVAEVVIMLISMGITVPKVKLTVNCSVISSPGTLMAYWLSSLSFETFLFVLTAHRFLRYVATHRIYDGTIMFIFMRDGTWAFAIIFAALLLNAIFCQLIHSPLVQAGYFWVLGVMSFTGSHVLLNIRRFANQQSEEELPIVHSAVVFTRSDILSEDERVIPDVHT